MISALVLTKNEEKNIKKCLQSLSWCDELILIDDYSEDKTLQIVRACHCVIKIYKRKLNNNFAAQRNFGLSKAKGDWILFIDADEVVSKSLREEIREKTKKQNGFYISKACAFSIKRKDYFLGKEDRKSTRLNSSH